MSLHLSAGKIPGHSGTDFKHKKAFTKIKAYRTLFPVPLPPSRFEDLSAKERQLLRHFVTLEASSNSMRLMRRIGFF